MPDHIVNSRESLDAYIQHLNAQWEKHKYLKVSIKTGKQRTLTQNACIHKYCDMIATNLNDAGLDMVSVLSEGASIPWSDAKVKEDIWRKVQTAMTGKKSTTDLDRNECGEIYDVISRHLSSTFGVFVPWPSKDTMIAKESFE